MQGKCLGFPLIALGIAVGMSGANCRVSATDSAAEIAQPIDWRSNYRAALEEARQNRAMVVLWFVDPDRDQENQTLELEIFRQCDVACRLASCVSVKLSTDSVLTISRATESAAPASANRVEENIRLLDHPAFEELLGQRGLALIDMRDEASPHFRHVVSVFPFSAGPITTQQLVAMLDLPDGTLTQRTLIWAVRTHPEQPASADEEPGPILMQEAANHAGYQARIRAQGHHDWDARFHRINEQLPAHLVAQEVCAESWPGQRLVEAAQECVHSWRQSGGHWEAVRTRHPLFGYDMQRGSNGIWYATGIFGRQR